MSSVTNRLQSGFLVHVSHEVCVHVNLDPTLDLTNMRDSRMDEILNGSGPQSSDPNLARSYDSDEDDMTQQHELDKKTALKPVRDQKTHKVRVWC
jgi:hypothetical protein